MLVLDGTWAEGGMLQQQLTGERKMQGVHAQIPLRVSVFSCPFYGLRT